MARALRYIAQSMPVFRLSDMTQRAPLFLTSVLLAFALPACGNDSNAALFSDNGIRRSTGGSASSGTGGSEDASGGSASGGAPGKATGGAAQGGTTGSSGGGTGSVASGSASASGGATSGGASGASGGTTNSGGGSATGGKAQTTGGTGGGPSPDAGSGGGEADSGSDTGGAPPDSGKGTGGFATDAKIRCGDTFCDKSAGQLCCVKDGPMRVTATCVASAMGCAHVFRCDSDSDCASGEHCCMEFSNSSSTPNTPSTSCARQCDTPISCSAPEDCHNGQSCCGVVVMSQQGGIRYGSVACQDRCGQDTPFCVDNSPCNNGNSCQQSQTLPPGYQVCRQ